MPGNLPPQESTLEYLPVKDLPSPEFQPRPKTKQLGDTQVQRVQAIMQQMDSLPELGAIGHRVSRHTGHRTKVFEDEGTGGGAADGRVGDAADDRVGDAGVGGVRKPLSISSKESEIEYTNKEDARQEEVAGVRE